MDLPKQGVKKEDESADMGSFMENTTANRGYESPKRGTTLSTSTSSFEALDPHDPNLSRLANTMFQKTAEYLQEELTATHADYRLLERLNKETIAKYTELKIVTSNVAQTVDTLNDKYAKLQPILDNINEIDESVTKLEQAAYKLAAYSKRLEAKCQNMLKESEFSSELRDAKMEDLLKEASSKGITFYAKAN